MAPYDDQGQSDPLAQARQRAREEIPQPAPEIAQMGAMGEPLAVGLRGAGGTRNKNEGLDGMCNSLFSSVEKLEMALARLEMKLDPLMGPEIPTTEGAQLYEQPIVQSRIGHQLQEIGHRVNRMSMVIYGLVSRIDA